MLWGEDGPYSEAKLIMNTRILDNRISRVTVEVDGFINPTTFRFVKKHLRHFADDRVVLELLETAKYEGRSYGYHVSLGFEELASKNDEGVMERAQEKLRMLKDAIVRMHQFMLDHLEEGE